MPKPSMFSHSQINSWQRCGKAYYLEKVAQVPQQPAVYLVTGNALHAAIENLNRAAAAAGKVVEGE